MSSGTETQFQKPGSLKPPLILGRTVRLLLGSWVFAYCMAAAQDKLNATKNAGYPAKVVRGK